MVQRRAWSRSRRLPPRTSQALAGAFSATVQEGSSSRSRDGSNVSVCGPTRGNARSPSALRTPIQRTPGSATSSVKRPSTTSAAASTGRRPPGSSFRTAPSSSWSDGARLSTTWTGPAPAESPIEPCTSTEAEAPAAASVAAANVEAATQARTPASTLHRTIPPLGTNSRSGAWASNATTRVARRQLARNSPPERRCVRALVRGPAPGAHARGATISRRTPGRNREETTPCHHPFESQSPAPPVRSAIH